MKNTPLNSSPNGNCRRFGHEWDIDRPSIFAPDYEPPAEPITATCRRCGDTRTDFPDGGREYQWGWTDKP